MRQISPDTKSIIYGLSSNEDGIIRYVGRTIKPLNERLSEHLYDARHPENSLCPDTHKGRWIRRVEEDGFYVQIHSLEETTVADQDEREQYWVSYFGRDNLVNGTDGGNTVNMEKNRHPTVSFERIRACLKKNNKKTLLEILKNVHYTKYGTYSQQDILDDELRRNLCREYKVFLDNNTTVSECIDVMNEAINKVVGEDIDNLRKIYNTKSGKETVDWAYRERILHRARYIPKTNTKLEQMVFELFEEKEYGIYRHDNIRS